MYAYLLAKGFESEMPSVERAENNAINQDNIRIENVNKLSNPLVHVAEPLNRKKNYHTLYDRIVEETMLSVIGSSKPV